MNTEIPPDKCHYVIYKLIKLCRASNVKQIIALSCIRTELERPYLYDHNYFENSYNGRKGMCLLSWKRMLRVTDSIMLCSIFLRRCCWKNLFEHLYLGVVWTYLMNRQLQLHWVSVEINWLSNIILMTFDSYRVDLQLLTHELLHWLLSHLGLIGFWLSHKSGYQSIVRSVFVTVTMYPTLPGDSRIRDSMLCTLIQLMKIECIPLSILTAVGHKAHYGQSLDCHFSYQVVLCNDSSIDI